MKDKEIKVLDFLESKGFRLSNKGTQYLKHYLLDETISAPFEVCRFYAELGRKHGDTYSRVERSLRHCISNSKYKGNQTSEVLAKIKRDYYRFILEVA